MGHGLTCGDVWLGAGSGSQGQVGVSGLGGLSGAHPVRGSKCAG